MLGVPVIQPFTAAPGQAPGGPVSTGSPTLDRLFSIGEGIATRISDRADRKLEAKLGIQQLRAQNAVLAANAQQNAFGQGFAPVPTQGGSQPVDMRFVIGAVILGGAVFLATR